MKIPSNLNFEALIETLTFSIFIKTQQISKISKKISKYISTNFILLPILGGLYAKNREILLPKKKVSNYNYK